MKGDPYILQDVQRIPSGAVSHAWPGKVVVMLYNERNTVTNILIVDEDVRPLAWPDTLEDEVLDLVTSFKAEIVDALGRL